MADNHSQGQHHHLSHLHSHHLPHLNIIIKCNLITRDQEDPGKTRGSSTDSETVTQMNETGCISEQSEYQLIFYKTQKTNIIFFTNAVKKKKTRR